MKYHITGAYFSPTGGTKRAIETLCSFWEGEKTFLELGGKRREVTLGSEDLLVLALPVYADTIPAVPGLLDGLHGTDTPCVVVATYGNCKYGHALAQTKKLMGERGFRCVAGIAVITPHVFAPVLGSERPDREDREELASFAARVEEKLAQADWQEAELPGDPDPVIRRIPALEKVRDMDICMECGHCARVCPTGAMNTMTLVWDNDKCISCMTCVARCPNGALSFHNADIANRLTAAYSERQPISAFL